MLVYPSFVLWLCSCEFCNHVFVQASLFLILFQLRINCYSILLWQKMPFPFITFDMLPVFGFFIPFTMQIARVWNIKKLARKYRLLCLDILSFILSNMYALQVFKFIGRDTGGNASWANCREGI